MKKLIVSSLCVLLGVFFIMSSKLYANELMNDFIEDPNNYLVFIAFTALPNVPEINEDPNVQTFIPSGFCYGCHQARHILDPSDPNNNFWREAGAAPIYGDQVDGIYPNNTKKMNHHPMGTQARLSDSKFVRAPGSEATEHLNKNEELTCISCHADFHGVIDRKDYNQSKENNFLRWDFTDDNANFCIECHSDKNMVSDGKHFWNADSPITREVFNPNAPNQDYEKTIFCKQCMFCHFIHDGEERDNESVSGSIRADIDALMRVGPESLAWGDRTNDTDRDDYEDMCYGCHSNKDIVGEGCNTGALLRWSNDNHTHRFASAPDTNNPPSTVIEYGGVFPLSDGKGTATKNDYGTQQDSIFCGTCHNVHKGINQPYLRSNRSPYEAYGFCEACHDKDGQFVSKSHPINVEPNPDPAQGAPTKAEFVDTYNGGSPLFSQGGSGKPGGITSPYDPATGESTSGGSGKIICLTCHNVHTAETSWEGKTKTDSNQGHGHLLIKDNMRERRQLSSGSELCKACHPFGASEYSFPEGVHGDDSLSPENGICSNCHTPHNATGPKLWSIDCRENVGCYDLGPFKGFRQLCFSCHNITKAPTGSKTVFKGLRLGASISSGYYPEDHVMRQWADITDREGVLHYDPNTFPLDIHDQDTIPNAYRIDPYANYGFYCGSCHNPHLEPDVSGEYYLRSKDGDVGSKGQRKKFCDQCHEGIHEGENIEWEAKEDEDWSDPNDSDKECMNCHHPHGGVISIDENPYIGRLILIPEFSDIMPPKLTGQDPHPGATELYPNTNIVFFIEDHGFGVDPNSIELFVQGINITAWAEKEDENLNKIQVICDPPFSFQYGESVQVLVKANDLATPFNAMEEEYEFRIHKIDMEYIIYSNIEIILTKPLKNEGCWNCHQDMYPNLALNPNSSASPNLSCFSDPNKRSYPFYYSTFDLVFNKRFFDCNPSANFTNGEIYKQRKKGHLTHLVYQPFGLGRLCLDCHDPARYIEEDPNIPHISDCNVYFKDGEKISRTSICRDCHGGFYPEVSEVLPDDPKIDPNSVRLLKWGDPGSVTCIQCHDDSSENGGMYATYENRYTEYFDGFNDSDYDPNITAPDPDKVPGQNYWSKNGHGVTAQKRFAGATLDTGYPDPNRKDRTYPNIGAMNSKNIPYDPSDPNNKHSQRHDLNLDSNDGRKNFCWECHWSNEIMRKTVCIDTRYTYLFPKYPEGFPIGKYNGHLDKMGYRDERWGPVEMAYMGVCMGHYQWKLCRECHPTKYSHFGYPELGHYQTRQRRSSTIERYSHCVICHNPHGSGDKQGNANVFMIKRRIYNTSPCYNCHNSQFRGDIDSPDPNTDTWVVNFFDPLIQDIREPDSPENSISIPASTTDICEVCHQDKAIEYWPNPNSIDFYGIDYRHRNGSRHYFNPNFDPNNDNDNCSGPNTCTIDYRGTDCTGCHIHDPDPPLPLPPYTPDEQQKVGDPYGLYPFNSKAFAPTCRCHGIGRIDIATLSYETYWGDGNKPVIAGKGHGTPPPPFPIVDPNDPEKDPNQDVHLAHARYNLPCFRCHIDPDDLPYDPNTGYIFDLDGNTPIGFDHLMNPNGIYEEFTKTCSNLYCHSNGKGTYADPIAWSATERFCRDSNDIMCIDPNDQYFIYCDNCHKTPPDANHIYHSSLITGCETCHPHNGIYKGNPGFYKHVNGKVDSIRMEMNFPAGWSMISLPRISNDAYLSALFPEAEVVYKFERESGYVRVKKNEGLKTGYGYWILFNEDQDYAVTGQPICSFSKTVYSDGWEMIGGCTFEAKAFVDNGNIDVIYKYVQGNGYVRLLESENLKPGEGYWILIDGVIGKAVLTVKLVGS